MEFAKWNLEAHRGLWWKTKYLPLKTEKKLSEKLLCVLLVHLTELKLSPQEAVHLDFSCEILKVIFGNPLKAMVKKEISSFNNWKEIFWETAVFSVNTSHRVTAFLSRSLSLRLFLWNLQCDIWMPIEGYAEKGNIFRSKLGRSFLRNCSVYREFISQSDIIPFKKPFAKAVLVELAKGYLEAPEGLRWKRKYLPFKTGKKLSEKLLCVLLIHLTELHLSLQEAFR